MEDKQDADPRAKEGTELATAPAAATGTAEQGPDLAKTLPGEGTAEKIEALFDKHFRGTEMTNHTHLWNMAHAFKEDVKKLVAK